jgi:hypothetical protein
MTKKILLLDPSANEVQYFKTTIMPEISFQAVLIAASKTQTAIDLLENNDFDIIISHVFPITIINGLNIVARLRNGDFGAVNRAALTIAYVPIGFDITASVDAGFDAHLRSGRDAKSILPIFKRYIHLPQKRIALQLNEE